MNEEDIKNIKLFLEGSKMDLIKCYKKDIDLQTKKLKLQVLKNLIDKDGVFYYSTLFKADKEIKKLDKEIKKQGVKIQDHYNEIKRLLYELNGVDI